jgi:hypothetical protein
VAPPATKSAGRPQPDGREPILCCCSIVVVAAYSRPGHNRPDRACTRESPIHSPSRLLLHTCRCVRSSFTSECNPPCTLQASYFQAIQLVLAKYCDSQGWSCLQCEAVTTAASMYPFLLFPLCSVDETQDDGPGGSNHTYSTASRERKCKLACACVTFNAAAAFNLARAP